MQVRPARAEDAEAIARSQRAMAWETERIRLDAATVAAGVRAVLDDPTRGRYWIAETDGQTVGVLLVTPEWSDWRNAWVWWIQSLYVLPAHRRTGVFGALYAHLRTLVEHDGTLAGIRLYVAADNLTARRAYEAMGMDGEHYRLFEWLK
ncbi:MAG: GNAT family N-acetyltransferase [Candidatus Brocadiaceae bacterium]|nr:GNAT family N-acetyltransferase [Candidatus Brocadiaceae bacterium]